MQAKFSPLAFTNNCAIEVQRIPCSTVSATETSHKDVGAGSE
jgi:hypothetical protein